MWSAYSAREAAEVVGLPESTVRGCARAGLLAGADGNVALRFSFRDLSVLRVVKTLTTHGVPMRRIRRQLGALRRRLSEASSLSELSLSAVGRDIVVRSGPSAWVAESGQMVFEFEVGTRNGTNGDDDPGEATVQPLPVRREAAAPVAVPGMNADAWFERAMDLEDVDTRAAIEAYRQVLRLRPECTETLVNLGRLLAETGDGPEARDCFQAAIRIDSADATAIYNLGVVAQDDGDDAQAVELYTRALRLDPGLAEAHYNLATIFDRRGEAQAAIRHINEYRKLTR